MQRYQNSVGELAEVRERLQENRRRLQVVTANQDAAEAELSARLAAAYRSGEDDLVAALLGAGSLEEALARLDVARRSSSSLADLLRQIDGGRREFARRQRELDRDRDRAAELVAVRDAQRQEVEEGLARQQAAIRGLEADIERLKREEAERQRRLAEQARRRLEAAKRAAAAAAAAQPEPDIGGSGGGSDAGDDGGGSDGGGNADEGGGDTGGDGIEPPPPTDGTLGARAVSAAMRWLGTPYSWGGGDASGPTFGSCGPAGCQGLTTRGFDCSGLTLYAYAQVGISLGHYTGSQWTAGTRVGYDELIPGDLVFFGGDLGHMGMYMGGGQMIHAPHTGDVVKISDISSGYYRSGFRGGVRPY